MPRRNAGPRLKWLEKRGCFYIVWTEGGRSRERSTGATDSSVAEVALAQFLRSRRSEGPAEPSETLITDLLTDYAESKSETVASPERIGFAIGPLAQFWEARFASAVTPETCRAYGRWRGKSDGTVRRELGVLRAALNHAHREGRLSRQVPVELPNSPEPKDRWLTRAEAARLIKAAMRSSKARLHLPLFILIGLYTGKRSEAILSLRWTDVDFDNRRIDFNPPGRKRTTKRRPKNPIPPRLLPHLLRAKRRGSDIGPVVHIDGKPVGSIKKAFAAACLRAGLVGVTPHTLRHTCATWLMQSGIDPWEASGFLGMSRETLERVYGHHHPDYQSQAASAFSGVRGMSAQRVEQSVVIHSKGGRRRL